MTDLTSSTLSMMNTELDGGSSLTYLIAHIEVPSDCIPQETLQDIESKSNLLNNDIKLLKQQVRQMKESVLIRHQDIKRQLEPKIELLAQYHSEVSNEAITQNDQAIDALRMLRNFNQKSQEHLLEAGQRINGLYRRVGSFS